MLDLKEYSNNKEKFCFVGLSVGSAGSLESGLSILDRNLNLIRIDKVYNITEIKSTIENAVSPSNTILCVDLPKNIMMLTGKWRIESKQTQILHLNDYEDNKKPAWRRRFSDRGTDLCNHFQEVGMEVYRYNSEYTKNLLKLNSPYKSRSPAGCKFLQNIFEEKLGISNIPSNLIPLPSLNAVVGAYIGWKIATSEENFGYKQISVHKKFPVVSATNI